MEFENWLELQQLVQLQQFTQQPEERDNSNSKPSRTSTVSSTPTVSATIEVYSDLPAIPIAFDTSKSGESVPMPYVASWAAPQPWKKNAGGAGLLRQKKLTGECTFVMMEEKEVEEEELEEEQEEEFNQEAEGKIKIMLALC
ncbi:hypothetical protein ACFE04_016984 [Oxalis oulophora]